MSDYTFKSKQKFKFLEKVCGVNQDGEKYICVTVLGIDNKKYSFLSHNDNIINTVNSLSIEQFADIVVFVGFNYIYNHKTRFSNWKVDLLGVE